MNLIDPAAEDLGNFKSNLVAPIKKVVQNVKDKDEAKELQIINK